MKLKNIFLIWIFCLSSFSFAGLENLKDSKWSTFSDITLGVGQSQAKSAVSWKRGYGLWNEKIIVGMGPRFSMLGSLDSHSYAAASSSNPLKQELLVNHYLFAALNLAFEFRVAVLSWLELGANIDLIGFGGGNPARSNYSSTTGLQNGLKSTNVPNLNYLTLKNDRGQLDSEVFANIRFTRSSSIRAGLSHYLSEIETLATVEGKTRFQRFSNLLFISYERRFK